MNTVIYAQFVKDRRKPLVFIIFIGISILATVIFGESSRQTVIEIDVFATGTHAKEIEQKWIELLNHSSSMKFVIENEKEARKKVIEGKKDVALLLMENDYRLITSSNMPEIMFIEKYIHQVFTEEAKLLAAVGNKNSTEKRKKVNEYLEQPPLTVELKDLNGEKLTSHDMGTQLLFGFTLFIAMFTIGFKVNGINGEKVSGVWKRLLLSPVGKTNMYVGHLLYSFIVGYLQMTIVFLIFQYMMNYNIGSLSMILTVAGVYTLSTVSFAMLIAGLTGTPEKFNMIYHSIVPIIPIICGIYMPPGVMENAVFNFLSKLFPLSYGVDAMMDVALFQASWSDISLPLAAMLLMTVLYMGIGINVGERKK